MERTFGKSMVWLHTWTGVLLGSLLFAIFWMGTLSVFDREIDRWMMPQTRLASTVGEPGPSLDRIARAVVQAVPADARLWRIDLATERVPTLRLSWRERAGSTSVRQLDPATLALIPEQGTYGGTGFIFPFHYGLHLKWMDLGKWLVGLAAMGMLVLLVSGVIVHKKILVQFFTFRPHKRLQRSALDLHNLTGVIGLPFHFVITLSGLIIFIGMYFPQAYVGAYDGGAKAAYTAEAYGRYARPRANAPGSLASLDAMVRDAERAWGVGQPLGGSPSAPSFPYFVRVWHPGDANSYVELRRSYASDMTMNMDQLYFDAGSGALLHRFEAAPVMTAQRLISGLHFIQFEHWTLRWLYFLAGLSGCVLIATGFLFWLEARRTRHAKKGLAGVRLVEGLTIGSVTGIMIATLAFLIANRLLPLSASLGGIVRADLEVWVFYLAWIAAFAHAWLRPGHGFASAWREQAWLIAVMSVLAVLLNWLSTGDHLPQAIANGRWAVAGIDLTLLTVAMLAIAAARRLGRASGQVAGKVPGQLSGKSAVAEERQRA